MAGARQPHRCPRKCHRCPDLVAIVAEQGGDTNDPDLVTMPGCFGGSIGYPCHCLANQPMADTARGRREQLEHLARLVELYPSDARRLVAALPLPRGSKPRAV